MKLLNKTLSQWRFTQAKQLNFLRQWHKADTYGLSTKEFCQSLINNGQGEMRAIGEAGLNAPSQGKRFVEVLTPWFPLMVLTTIRAAEIAGDRKVGIETAMAQLKGGEKVMFTLMRLLAFPYCLCVGMGAYGVVIADKMLATLHQEPGQLEGIGMMVRNAIAHYGLLVAIFFVLALIGLALLLPRWSGPNRALSDEWPLFSLYRLSVGASLLKTLGNLTRCGMKLGDALNHASDGNSAFARAHIAQMKRQSIGQSNLGHIIDTGLLLPEEKSALTVLGERVSYSELLLESADNHKAHVKSQLSKMALWLPKVGLLLTILVLGALIMSATYQVMLSF